MAIPLEDYFREVTHYITARYQTTTPGINYGFCYIWAYMVKKLAGRYVELIVIDDYGGHAFIKYKGKFYDSECWGGVEKIKDLRCFKRARERPTNKKYDKPLTIKAFLAHWRENGMLAQEDWLDTEFLTQMCEIRERCNLR